MQLLEGVPEAASVIKLGPLIDRGCSVNKVGRLIQLAGQQSEAIKVGYTFSQLRSSAWRIAMQARSPVSCEVALSLCLTVLYSLPMLYSLIHHILRDV